VLAAAALKLVEQGKLALDAPMSGAGYTLRQLLKHRAGVPEYAALPAYHEAVAARGEAWSPAELLRRTTSLGYAEPGTTWTYSNLGYLHVRTAIEAAYGAPLGDALAALVIEPLALPGVRLAADPADLSGVEMPGAADYDPRWVYHGLLVGPVGSAATFLDRLLSGEVLRPESLQAMRQGWPLPEFSGPVFAKAGYGLGLMVCETPSGQPMIGHTGGGPGSGAAIYAFERPGQRRVVAVWAGAGEGSVEQAALDRAG
jgi:CubicO group peptidase (beta-lactamase class C family)